MPPEYTNYPAWGVLPSLPFSLLSPAVESRRIFGSVFRCADSASKTVLVSARLHRVAELSFASCVHCLPNPLYYCGGGSIMFMLFLGFVSKLQPTDVGKRINKKSTPSFRASAPFSHGCTSASFSHGCNARPPPTRPKPLVHLRRIFRVINIHRTFQEKRKPEPVQ